jgi:uncharacterized protein
MSHRIDGTTAEYTWRSGSDRCAIRVETEGEAFLPEEGSVSQFITEHYWGYAAQKDGGCLEYEVQHPRWKVWRAKRVCGNGIERD